MASQRTPTFGGAVLKTRVVTHASPTASDSEESPLRATPPLAAPPTVTTDGSRLDSGSDLTTGSLLRFFDNSGISPIRAVGRRPFLQPGPAREHLRRRAPHRDDDEQTRHWRHLPEHSQPRLPVHPQAQVLRRGRRALLQDHPPAAHRSQCAPIRGHSNSTIALEHFQPSADFTSTELAAPRLHPAAVERMSTPHSPPAPAHQQPPTRQQPRRLHPGRSQFPAAEPTATPAAGAATWGRRSEGDIGELGQRQRPTLASIGSAGSSIIC